MAHPQITLARTNGKSRLQSDKGQELRLLYLAGSGDATDVLRHYARGERYEGVAHATYSAQVYDVCQRLGVPLLAISSNARADDFRVGDLRSINLPDLFPNRTGIAYHLGNVRCARQVIRFAKMHGANVVVSASEPYPFLLNPLAWQGIRIIVALHATLLPEFKEPTKALRLFTRMSRRFFQRTCAAVLSHPGACARQARTVAGGRPRPILEFLPYYDRSTFEGFTPPDPKSKQFRVITVGRVEREKGVFDLIEVARRIVESGRSDIKFDVCGTGSALDAAREKVKQLSLDSVFTLHGWTEMSELSELWRQSSVAVVPTTRDFVEGFNQVVIEAMLAGRPVVTSAVCPALDYVRPSCYEVPPDDIDAYKRAILALADDRDLYDKLQSRTRDVAKQFLDPSKSFMRALSDVLSALADGRQIQPVAHPPSA